MLKYYYLIIIVIILIILLSKTIPNNKKQLEKYKSNEPSKKKFKSSDTNVYDKMVISNVNGDLNTIGCPKGVIWLWSGSIENIPEGWALCNGENGTPDLRGRFVIGVNPNSKRNTNFMINEMGATGGKEKALLKHKHQYFQNVSNDDGFKGGRTLTYESGNSTFVLTSDRGEPDGDALKPDYVNTSDTSELGDEHTLPPYYSLAYIMKTI